MYYHLVPSCGASAISRLATTQRRLIWTSSQDNSWTVRSFGLELASALSRRLGGAIHRLDRLGQSRPFMTELDR